MERRKVPYDYRLNDTLARLVNPGLLLVGTKRDGTSNVMAIGWASVGIVWGKPMFPVMVRPSRYTYEFIEDSGVFTVNVPGDDLRAWVGVCGTQSGRNVDKFGAYNMTVTRGQTVDAVTIDACPMVYECRVVYYDDVVSANLSAEIEGRAYKGRDYHRIYYGEILAAYAAEGY